MKDFDPSRYGFAVAAFVLALSGCSSSQSPMASSALPQGGAAAQQFGATPACGGSRIGQAQCDVLIENKGARPNYNGWSASQLEQAYNLPSSSGGNGQTVAIVDAYDNPDVVSDFAKYRSGMGLPPGTLNKYNQSGQMSNYPQGSPNWGVEIDLDVDMVSASCPNCTVNLIEANSNAWSDLEAAEQEAVKLGATIVSNSYDGSGGNESNYDTPGVTYLASAGDSGLGLYDPATFDSVVAVGGTILSISSGSRGYSESLWGSSGGGCSSTGEKKPKWQLKSKWAKNCSGRMGNDVSAVAVNAAEYDTYSAGGWITVDGTSISSPFCAGVFALAGNSTKQDGGRTFWKPKKHQKHLYEVGGARFTDQGGFGTPDGTGAF
ncbi:MAG: S8 family serine peptidase [Candidatus Cybelea sp.]